MLAELTVVVVVRWLASCSARECAMVVIECGYEIESVEGRKKRAEEEGWLEGQAISGKRAAGVGVDLFRI